MTRATLVILPAAERDADEYYDQLLEEAGPVPAARFEASLAETLERLARFPRIGALYHRLRMPGLRFVLVDHFPKVLVFHRSNNGEVTVVRVLHSARRIRKSEITPPSRSRGRRSSR